MRTLIAFVESLFIRISVWTEPVANQAPDAFHPTPFQSIVVALQGTAVAVVKGQRVDCRYAAGTQRTQGEKNMKATFLAVIALLLASTGSLAQQPSPTAVRVLASNGVKAVMESIMPDIERAVGHPLSVEFSTASALKTKIDAGEPFDVTVLTPSIIDALIAQGTVVGASRMNFARAGVGVGARPGTPHGDISTVEGLKQTLLDAKSIAFTGDGQSRITIDKAFDTLGIAEAMRAKTVLKGPGQAPEAVAAGEADFVMTLVSEIMPVAGIELIGPLPAAVQGYISFTAGRGAKAKDRTSADAVLAYLGSPAALSALKSHGMEPYGN
jgi:molybdate transport system substrate-binding protein